MSAGQQPQPQPPATNPPSDPNTIVRTIIIRNKEIIGELMRLAESSNMTIQPLSATGLISQAELTPRGSPEPVTVVNFFWNNNQFRILSELRPSVVQSIHQFCLLALQSFGNKEVILNSFFREQGLLTITTNREICGSLASFSQRTGQIIYLRNATGKISDGTVYSYTRQEMLTNLGRADILQLTGHVFPNRTGRINLTLSGVFGGTAKAYRLITDGDVVLEVTLVRNQ